MARAEDRAPWRHDPSADPGTKTEGGRHDAALSSPSGLVRKRQIEAVCPRVHYLISQPRFLHFTLNHYKGIDGEGEDEHGAGGDGGYPGQGVPDRAEVCGRIQGGHEDRVRRDPAEVELHGSPGQVMTSGSY